MGTPCLEVQGLDDKKKTHSRCPLSRIKPFGMLLNMSYGVYVSLFKVRLGRGAPYGDFLISYTSVCCTLIIKLFFPLS